MRPDPLPPTGLDLICQAVHELDVARNEVHAAEQSLILAKSRKDQAEANLAHLIATNACTEANGCRHLHGMTTPPAAPSAAIAPPTLKPLIALDDSSVAKKYRIAFTLLANPVLDYGRTAEAIWGPLDRATAKNRVNSQMQQLKLEQIVRSLGSRRYAVDRELLSHRSGISIPEVTPAT